MTRKFSLYLDRTSGLHRLHPLTKLSLAGFFLIAALLLPGVWPNYVVFLFLLLPLATWGKIHVPFLRIVAPLILPFAISLTLIQGFFWADGTVLFALGPLSLKLEGLLAAVRGIGKILLMLSSIIFFSLSTRPDVLMQALTERGLPRAIGYIILTTLQIVPRFQARAAMILDAQQARGLEISGSLLRRLRALVPLVLPLVLSSIVDIEERAIALEARGFSRAGPRTSLLTLRDTPAQVIMRWALVAVLAMIVLARLIAAI